MRTAQLGRAAWLSLRRKPRLRQRRSSGRLYSRHIDCSDSRGPWCVRWQADAGGRWQARTRSTGGCQLLIVTVLQNGCCFNILYRFLCNTLTRCAAAWSKNQFSPKGAPPTSPPFVKSQSRFNDAWRNIQALTFHCQVSLEKSIKIIPLWPSYPVNAY